MGFLIPWILCNKKKFLKLFSSFTRKKKCESVKLNILSTPFFKQCGGQMKFTHCFCVIILLKTSFWWVFSEVKASLLFILESYHKKLLN